MSHGNHHIDENLTNEEKCINNTDELDLKSESKLLDLHDINSADASDTATYDNNFNICLLYEFIKDQVKIFSNN